MGEEGKTPRPDWAIDAIGEEAYEALASRLSPSKLWSLLLAVLGRRAESRAPAEVLRQWERDAFTRLSAVDQRTMAALDLCPSLPTSMRTHHLQTGVGHYGVFAGKRWQQEIYPRVRAMMQSYS